MRRYALSAAALLLLAASTPAALAQTRLNAAYSVYLTGIPIGQGAIIVDLNEAGYAAAGSAKFTGLVRMISKGEGTSTVRGSFANNRVISSLYSMQSHSVDRDERSTSRSRTASPKSSRSCRPRKTPTSIACRSRVRHVPMWSTP